MADPYCFPLLLELEENQVPKLRNKLVKYFQSKRSGGGDCEVDFQQGERTAVLRFRREEDQENVLKRGSHEVSLDQGVLRMTVRPVPAKKPRKQESPPVTPTPTPTPTPRDRKSQAAVVTQQPAPSHVQAAPDLQPEAEGDHDDVEDEASSCTSAVIGNIDKSIKLEFLEMLVEKISRNQASPWEQPSFTMQDIPDISSAVVTFQSAEENTSFLAKCLQNKTFVGKGLSVRPLEATQQVVVEDIQNIDVDILRLYFDDEGLEVDKIVTDEDGESAVVTFKSPEGVKKLTEKKHKIKEKEFRVFPFYESLGVVLYGKDAPSLKLPADISETIDHAVWKYLTDNPSAAKTIHSDLEKHCCKVDLSQPVVHLSPVSALLQRSGAKAAIKKWTGTVTSAFTQAMSQFKSLQFPTESHILEECEMTIVQMKENVVVVPDRAKGVLSVGGLVKDVDRLQKPLTDLITKIEKRVQREKSSETQCIKMSPSTFHILSQDGLERRLLQLFPELIVLYEKQTTELKIIGTSNEILVGYKAIIDIMMSMKRQHLEVDGFLLDLLKSEQEEKLTEAFLTSRGMNVAFEITASRVQLLGISEKDLKQAHDHLSQLLKSHYLDVEDREVLNKPEWQQLVNQVEKANSKPCRTQICITGTQVVVSGFKDNVTTVSRELNDFISENTPVEETIVVKPQVILEYIQSQDASWLMQFKNKVVVTYRLETICLSGSRADVTTCKDLFDDVVTSVSFDTLKIAKPGVKKFFQEKKDMYITSAKKDTGCLVRLVDDTRGLDSTSLFPQPAYRLQTADGVEIAVCKADMCAYPVHAVVNSSNMDLKHNGGLAEALLKAAGPQLQDECDRYIQTKGQLKPGESVITSAGGQLHCQKIIHTVAPKYESMRSPKSVAQLKRAVKTSLELAEDNNCSTVALPIISRGLDFPIDLCAATIVKAVEEHLNENCDYTILKMIHFVNNDDAAVQAMEVAVRQRFGNHGSSATQKNAKSKKHSIVKNVTSEPCLCCTKTNEGLDIILKKGLIEAATTDVIVNVVFEDLALNRGAVSNAILLEAGSKLQKQILAKAPSGNFGDIIVTDGCKLKSSHVFHAVTPQWDNGKGASETTLKGIFRDCLVKAENAGLASISFPAIGTGNLGFPKDFVMTWMLDEFVAFSNNNPKHLKKIAIVLFPGDLKTIQVFSDTFVLTFPNASNTSAAAASSGSGGPFSKVASQSGLHETTMGNVTIQIAAGDITKETSDIIVNSSNDSFTLKSGVSKAILDAAGPTVEAESQTLGASPNPGMIMTQAGNLKCNKILHLVGHTDPSFIKNRMKEALNMCIAKSYSSVSFPAIGTGQGGIKAKSVADAMLDGVIDVLSKNPASSLTTIRIVIFQPPMVNDFLSSMQERASSDHDTKNKGFWESIGLKLRALFTVDNTSKPQKDDDFTIEPLEVDPACFHICGDSQGNIDKAKQWITDLVTQEQTSTLIPDDAILSFTDAEHKLVCDIQIKLGVSIKTISKSSQSSFVIEGLSKDVLQASGEIYALLKKAREKEALDRKVRLAGTVAEWQCKHQGHSFKPLDALSNFKLEEALEKKRQSVVITFKGKDYTVTMPTGPAKDSQGATMDIKRIDKLKGEEVPGHWDAMPPNTTSHRVAIVAGNPEYDEVLKLFQATCPRTVVKIERIQNPVLWKGLQLKKRHMEDRKSPQTCERRLFHGTCEAVVSTINEYGFNRSYAGKNAAYYGNGTYFAVHAKYSAQDTYSPANQNNEKHMYLCRVLTGEFAVGKQGMVAPPTKGSGSIELYDSVTDNVQNPSMFVIFHDTQAYPEYLITFK